MYKTRVTLCFERYAEHKCYVIAMLNFLKLNLVVRIVTGSLKKVNVHLNVRIIKISTWLYNSTAFSYSLHVSPIKIPPQDQTQHIKSET